MRPQSTRQIEGRGKHVFANMGGGGGRGRRILHGVVFIKRWGPFFQGVIDERNKQQQRKTTNGSKTGLSIVVKDKRYVPSVCVRETCRPYLKHTVLGQHFLLHAVRARSARVFSSRGRPAGQRRRRDLALAALPPAPNECLDRTTGVVFIQQTRANRAQTAHVIQSL